MSYYPSNLGYIGLASQTAAKTTAKTTSKIFIRYQSETIGSEFEDQILKEGGNGKYNVTSVKTMHKESIAFTAAAYPNAAAYCMAALLGKDTVTGAGTAKTHTITIKTTDLATTPMQEWLTVEKMLTGTRDRYRTRAVKLSSITLAGEAGKPVTMTVEGTGISGVAVTTTKQVDSYQVTQPFCFYNGTYRINSALTTTTATTNFDINNFSIKITAGNDEGIQTTELTRKDIINHTMNVELTVGLNYTDYNLYRKANFAAGQSPSSGYSDSKVYLKLQTSSGANEKSLAITIPKVRLKPHKISLDPSPKTLQQPLSGVAFKQATTELLTVVCINSVATTMPY